MTPDEKKDTSDLADIPNYRTVVDLFYKHQKDSSPGKFLAELAVILDKNDEANQQVAKQKDDRIAELEDQASRMQFVPGHSECPKCGFHLVQSILHPNGISPNLETPQQCPNDGTEMISVSWIKHSQNMQKGQEAILERAVRAESTNAEMEKEKLNLLTCAANQAEEISTLTRRVKELESELNAWFKQCTSLKADNELLRSEAVYHNAKDALASLKDQVASLTSRLSEALGALKKLREFGSSMVNLFGEYLTESNHTEIFKESDAALNSQDNARLLERDRLRDAVVQAAKNCYENDDFITDWSSDKTMEEVFGRDKQLGDALKALEAHEKEGGA